MEIIIIQNIDQAISLLRDAGRWLDDSRLEGLPQYNRKR